MTSIIKSQPANPTAVAPPPAAANLPPTPGEVTAMVHAQLKDVSKFTATDFAQVLDYDNQLSPDAQKSNIAAFAQIFPDLGKDLQAGLDALASGAPGIGHSATNTVTTLSPGMLAVQQGNPALFADVQAVTGGNGSNVPHASAAQWQQLVTDTQKAWPNDQAAVIDTLNTLVPDLGDGKGLGVGTMLQNDVAGANQTPPVPPAHLPSTMMPMRPTQPLFGASGTPGPTDTGQGKLGDCFLLSSLNTVAALDPNLIKQNITPAGTDPRGADVYNVKLFVNGAWQEVRTTAEFAKDGSTAHALGSAGFWGQLYEKAAAQVAGGYGAINGGNTAQAMQMITGQSTNANWGNGQADGGGWNNVAGNDASLTAAAGGAPTAAADLIHGTGWYDTSTGAFSATQPLAPNNSVYLVADHTYSVTQVAGDQVSLDNPWNIGGCQISMSKKAFDSIWEETFSSQTP